MRSVVQRYLVEKAGDFVAVNTEHTMHRNESGNLKTITMNL